MKYFNFVVLYFSDLESDVWAFIMNETVHLRTFESRDTDIRTEYMATSLSVNSDGNFVVSDLGADTCRVFDPTGRLVCDFDVYPLSEPSHVLPLADGGGYLLSCCDGLQFYDSNGRHAEMNGKKVTFKDIKCPQCVALDSKQNYVVSDMYDCGSMIVTMDKDTLLPTGIMCGKQYSTSPEAFKKAWYIHVTTDDSVLVSDREDHMVKCYAKSGQFQWCAGGFGAKLGQFSTPAGVVEDRLGNVIVADSGNDRVCILTGDGQWLGAIVTEEQHGIYSPMDVAITTEGNLAVLQSNGTVSIFRYLTKVV